MDTPPAHDAPLVEEMRQGDLTAFDRLFEKYRNGLRAYVFGMLNDASGAEDIVQDCFVQLARHIDTVDPGKNVGGWLYRVARNKTIDCVRRRKFEVSAGESGLAAPPATDERSGPETPLEALVRAEEAAQVREALGKLPTGEREVVTMHYFGGLTFREIAGILRRPLGTVLWRAHNAMAKLAKEI